jgi:glycosyltransferase involved in cell wall biosynthesis
MATPLISVIVNTYNYGRFVEDAIDSVLAQDFPADRIEILVVDDGSTDDTADRVKKYGARIRYLHKENGDQASAATYGFSQSSGELIALLDGDDVWLPRKLSRVVEEFARNPRSAMVFHKYIFWDYRDDSTWAPSYFAEVSGDVLGDRPKLLRYSAAPTSSLVFRRDALRRLSTIPLDRPFNYDAYLIMAVLFLGPIGYVPELLAKNRVHGRNRWAADKGGPDSEILRRRSARLGAAIEVLRDWTRANGAGAGSQARTILRRYQLLNEDWLFELNPPARSRLFLHDVRHNLLYGPIMTRPELAYKWIYAVVALIVGKHAHYMEGIRTRTRRIAGHLRQRLGPAETQ